MAKKDFAFKQIVSLGLAQNDDEAKRLIMAGKLLYHGERGNMLVAKPGDLFPLCSTFSIKEKKPFAGRGALKLATAFTAFPIHVKNAICLDVGASTGGFTDFLLQQGCRRVYALDVGKNLLHEKLVNDPRVCVLDGINIRTASQNLITESVDFISIDVSFISLQDVLAPCLYWLKSQGQLVALIKPQFELGQEYNVRGVVQKEEYREKAVEQVCSYAQQLGLSLHGVVPSALKGPKGNQEYLALFSR